MDKYILSCFLLLTISGAVSANSVVNGTLGGSVYFDVSVSNEAGGFLTWTFKTALVLQNGVCLGQFRGRCTQLANGTLILKDITYNDAGEYTMNAYNSSGDVLLSGVYDLRVYATLTAPTLRTNVTSSPIIGGTNVTLQCDAGSQTVTTYSFSKDQKTICSDSQPPCRGQYLDFTPISESDSGSYTCTIQNPVSSNTSNSLTLNVYASVSNVTVISNVSGLVWPGLDSVSLRCSARGTNVSYSWSLRGAAISGGNQYQLSDNNTLLTISPVSSTDNGPFICTAKNLINSQNSNEVNLTLASPVSAVTLTSNTSGALWAGEDSVSLYCTAQGSAIHFNWSLSGNPVSSIPPYTITQSNSSLNSNLTISPVSKNDTGPITCTASNRANSVTSNAANLSINWAPNGNILCSADPIGENLQLGCSWPGGKPAANVTMIFNATESTSADGVLRNVTSSSNVHGRNLTCNGDQLGKNIKTCTLALEPPKSLDSPSNKTVKPGGPFTLTVDLISGTQTRVSTSSSQVLPAQFKWFHNNNSVDGGKFNVNSTNYASTLKIDKASASDSGEYKCIASNFFGNATFFFNVKVTDDVVVPDNNGLNGGQIAGIVIGVLAGVAIIGIIVFFVLKKKKRSSENGRLNPPEDQIGSAEYSEVKKGNINGAMTMSMSDIQEDKDDVKYAEIKFANSTKNPTLEKPEETVYSDVKNSSRR